MQTEPMEVYREDNLRVTWNRSATFYLERKIYFDNRDDGIDRWAQTDIMTSYVLGVEDAEAAAKWWIKYLSNKGEEQKDVE
jgi:hypothetical protein